MGTAIPASCLPQARSFRLGVLGGGLFHHIPHVIASCGEARAEPVAAELADDKVEELF